MSALPYLSQASLSKDTNWGVSETVALDMGLGTGASQVEKSSVLLELKKKKKASAINLYPHLLPGGHSLKPPYRQTIWFLHIPKAEPNWISMVAQMLCFLCGMGGNFSIRFEAD